MRTMKFRLTPTYAFSSWLKKALNATCSGEIKSAVVLAICSVLQKDIIRAAEAFATIGHKHVEIGISVMPFFSH
ncbi:hypothetical protein BHE74_00055765 [Ensete ventricosum]|nr:hypothetical protein BHE74_00055765 [Ensete ventricosum]